MPQWMLLTVVRAAGTDREVDEPTLVNMDLVLRVSPAKVGAHLLIAPGVSEVVRESVEQLMRGLQPTPRPHPDLGPIPPGLSPRYGVQFGCGKPDCHDCYEKPRR